MSRRLLRVHLAQLLARLSAVRVFVRTCPGGCRRPIDQPCRCDPRWRFL